MHDLLLQQGFDLMLYGMGTVLTFLTILVITTALMSVVMQRFFPDPDISSPVDDEPATPMAAVSRKTQAIIKAALDKHRAKHR